MIVGRPALADYPTVRVRVAACREELGVRKETLMAEVENGKKVGVEGDCQTCGRARALDGGVEVPLPMPMPAEARIVSRFGLVLGEAPFTLVREAVAVSRRRGSGLF